MAVVGVRVRTPTLIGRWLGAAPLVIRSRYVAGYLVNCDLCRLAPARTAAIVLRLPVVPARSETCRCGLRSQSDSRETQTQTQITDTQHTHKHTFAQPLSLSRCVRVVLGLVAGDLGMWRSGDMVVWTSEELDIWRFGDLKSWRPQAWTHRKHFAGARHRAASREIENTLEEPWVHLSLPRRGAPSVFGVCHPTRDSTEAVEICPRRPGPELGAHWDPKYTHPPHPHPLGLVSLCMAAWGRRMFRLLR